MEEVSDLIKVTSTLALTAAIYLVYENNSISIKEYDLFTRKTPKAFKGFKILHLNNLYGKNFGAENFRLLEKIYELNPDIIVTSGNMLTISLDKGWVFLELCKNLRRFYPIYYSVEKSLSIDNDKYNCYRKYLEELRNSGVILLKNDKVSLIKKDERLNIYGVFIDDDEIKASNYREKNGEINFSKDRIEKILGRPNKSEFNIVLTNEVINFDSYVKWGSDITFSGYTRNINRYIFNNLIEKKRGIFIEHDSSMVLSRGLGNKFLRVRIINRPEITLITIR
ncbi:metallophosphoesterase [Clostridium sp. B9]|uniref:metallophosphoesterase n=1 Tax=Clostridium sp. B9 TaxID=3423224 RepID=UPI003D2F39A7